MTHDPDARLVPVVHHARLYALGDAGAPETWLALHGYGQLGRFFARHLAPHAGPMRRVLVPEAPHRFYLDATYRRVGASWMTREERLADLDAVHAYLDAVLAGDGAPGHDVPQHDVAADGSDAAPRPSVSATAAGALPHSAPEGTPGGVSAGAVPCVPDPLNTPARHGPAGSRGVVGFGFSQGGIVLCRHAAARPGRFARLVLWGSGPPDDLALPDGFPSVTLVVGSDDAFLTPERLAAARSALDAARVPTTVVPYDGGHRLDAAVLARVVEARP